MTEHELTRFIDWLYINGGTCPVPHDAMLRSKAVRQYLAAPKRKSCGDPRPLDAFGHCLACGAGMERTKGD